MRIKEIDTDLLEKTVKKMRKDLQDKDERDRKSWLLFILDLERTITLLKQIQDPYGETDIS